MKQYEELIRANLKVVSDVGDEWMCHCYAHEDKKPSLQINVEKGLYICFSCGARGNIRKLTNILGVKYEEEVDIDSVLAKLNMVDEEQEQLPVLEESFLKRYRFPTPYWSSRGLNSSTRKAFDLGYDVFNNCVTIGLRNSHGELLGIIRRSLNKNADSRYINPKHFNSHDELFGSWFVRNDMSTTVVICEGPVDAMKVWQAGWPAVAIYGSSMSERQQKLLMSLGITRVVLFFDNDHAGIKATNRCLGFEEEKRNRKIYKRYVPRLDLRRNFLTSIVHYPDMITKTDPGAMNSLEIMFCIANATKLL